ncbi:MAG: type II toxin-antitoxin system antitoxin, RelB/DinJ family [Clostridiales bacterium]|nr:type II toxin-antitoxin system antitoxin, RelB/DinJ family [Clostridiales bacterium]MDR2750963.1 type II toxin-antitoxin system antitoxin, RelB/DinJ family [Clostridiales bacterium]
MPKTGAITIIVNDETKQCIEYLHASFGLTVSDAIKIFSSKPLMEKELAQDMSMSRDLGFPLKNRIILKTLGAMEEAHGSKPSKVQTKAYSSLTEMNADFEPLDSED